MTGKFDLGDVVTYVGSGDEWNHECCVGHPYKIIRTYPPVFGIYYYDIVTVTENYSLLEHEHYREVWSVRDYQLELKK